LTYLKTGREEQLASSMLVTLQCRAQRSTSPHQDSSWLRRTSLLVCSLRMRYLGYVRKFMDA
jgi:hypothetical protein